MDGLRFHKSSFCTGGGCVEVASVPGDFVKSSFCGAAGCVEVTSSADGSVVIRDSKDAAGPRLNVDARNWEAFVSIANACGFEFNRLPDFVGTTPTFEHTLKVSRLGEGQVLVWCSHDPTVQLAYTTVEWRAFLDGVKAGEFTLENLQANTA